MPAAAHVSWQALGLPGALPSVGFPHALRPFLSYGHDVWFDKRQIKFGDQSPTDLDFDDARERILELLRRKPLEQPQSVTPESAWLN